MSERADAFRLSPRAARAQRRRPPTMADRILEAQLRALAERLERRREPRGMPYAPEDRDRG